MESQLEPRTESTCEQCETPFHPKNRNGIKARFCKKACSTLWHNDQKVKGAALLKVKKRKVTPGVQSISSVSDSRVSQRIALELIPASERPALLAQAAERLGLTEGPVLKAARIAKAICQRSAVQRPFKSDEKIQALINQTADPERRLKLEAMLGVIQAHSEAA